jgi:hypothetical protein
MLKELINVDSSKQFFPKRGQSGNVSNNNLNVDKKNSNKELSTISKNGSFIHES